jgi:hypothetical protein
MLEVGACEADLSKCGLGPGEGIIIAGWISHKESGTLSMLNIARNEIGRPCLSEGWSESRQAYYSHHADHQGETIPEGALA